MTSLELTESADPSTLLGLELEMAAPAKKVCSVITRESVSEDIVSTLDVCGSNYKVELHHSKD